MVVRRLQENPNELYHHGVKGMRWGHRKQRVLVGRHSGRKNYNQAIESSSRPQRTTSQRLSDTLSKNSTKRALKIAGGVAVGFMALNAASHVIGRGNEYFNKSKSRFNNIDMETARKKAQMAEEWAERIRNGQNFFDARNSVKNAYDTVRSYSFRKNSYALPG